MYTHVSRATLPVLLLMAALAGCGGTAAPTSSSPARSVPASAASSTSAASARASSAGSSAATSGSAAASPSASGSPILVGVEVSQTGSFAPLGKDYLDGFNLYLSSVNKTIAGRKIEVVTADDQGQGDVGATKARGLVESNHVAVLTGIVATPVCQAVASYVKQVQVPLMVTAGCALQDLTTSPTTSSPYLTRFSFVNNMLSDPPADWAYKAGFRKAIIMTSDYKGGHDAANLVASTFIKAGGSVVQVLHPPLGTADFGPYLAQLNSTADVLFEFAVGTDALHFGQQFRDYVGDRKLQIVDVAGQMTASANLAQLGSKAQGVVGNDVYDETLNTPDNTKFLQLLHSKYPGRVLSGSSMANGYAAGEILAAALNKTGGRIEQRQEFLNALYATDLDTVKGHIKLDDHHDVVEEAYVYQAVPGSNGQMTTKVVQQYENVTQFWNRSPQEMQVLGGPNFQPNWVGMTKEQVVQLLQK